MVLLILSSGIIIGLFKLSQSVSANGFERMLPKALQRPAFQMNVGDGDLYFAGSSDTRIYLGSLVLPELLIEVRDSNIQKLAIDHGSFPKAKTSKIIVFPPYFFFADLVAFRIYRGTMRHWRLNEEIHPGGEFFTELIPVSHEGIVLRTIRSDARLFTLAKENFVTGERLAESPLLEKQVDGIFCTDGMLTFDKVTDQVVYTYFSRNQFLCADTSLQLVYRGRTIDTTFHTKIEVAAFPGTDGYVMASPPNIVNRRAAADGGTLYINSALVADNEDGILFNQVDVLDLYDLVDGHYRGSLYLERYQGKRLRHFMVSQGRVFVLTENILRVFKSRRN